MIGATIVEDKLQENVPETIKKLRIANIKVWMLTGDKMNTAYNIGLSCNLINKNMKIFNVCGIEIKKNENMKIINKDESIQVILDFAKEYNSFKGEYDSLKIPQFGILIDEKALLTINEDIDIQKIFLSIAKDANAVICCRVSPLQKAQVVKMIKNYDKNGITLAVGDGGNDISMIMEAHIGVGIYGEEGMRAVQSSDYAIGEFQFLSQLLFFHGRTNYVRNAECVKYFFYKNFVFTLVQFLYGFYCNFTGQTIIDDWFIATFNLIFTALPLAGRALLDHDIKPEDGEIIKKMLPFIYKENRDNPIFTIKNFILNMLKGLVHCFINFFIVIYVFSDESFDKKGNIAELWVISVTLFTNILMIVTSNLFIFTMYHTWINFVLIGVSTIVLYIVFIIIVHNWSYFNSVGTMIYTFRSSKIWLLFIFIVGTCILIDFTILAFHFSFNKNIKTILQLLYNTKGKIDNEEDLPNEIKEKLKLFNDSEGKKEKEDNKNNNIDNLKSKSVSNNEIKEKYSINLDNKEDNKESKLRNKSEKENEKSKKSKKEENKLKPKTRNKKINEINFSNNNSIDSRGLFISRSVSVSINESKNINTLDSKTSSKMNYNKNSYNNNEESESDEDDDIPQKTMEFMNNKNNNKNNNNNIIKNESEDFDDDFGDNFEDEFSEGINKEVKYFDPKQSNVPNLVKKRK